MMEDVPPEPNPRRDVAWSRRNRRALAALATLLVLAAALGELGPPGLSLNSTARPYNVFHLLAGLLGFAVLAFAPARGVAAFNLVFGSIDLYQAAAGLCDLPPAQLFGLRPADHVIHVVLGAALVWVALAGRPRRDDYTSVIQPSSSGQRPI
jgi:predicted membrane metal-binding protein